MFRSTPIIRWRKYQERYNLMGAKCEKCGKLHYPQPALCTCGSSKFIAHKFKGEGTLLSFTDIGSGPEAYAEHAPYCLGIIQLSEGPKITSQLSDCKLEDLKIGMQMIATFRKFYSSGEKGAIYYGTKFTPKW
ncbi:MAG: Zn-ribbon domain-containing OB-fold protein [Candidatus Diapherotrites archaeon]|nr:Zn-ribbon domain-containing OB-fold protein [Candidatus Diapherotrites archaeon]